jgi:hypothetical protein
MKTMDKLSASICQFATGAWPIFIDVWRNLCNTLTYRFVIHISLWICPGTISVRVMLMGAVLCFQGSTADLHSLKTVYIWSGGVQTLPKTSKWLKESVWFPFAFRPVWVSRTNVQSTDFKTSSHCRLWFVG